MLLRLRSLPAFAVAGVFIGRVWGFLGLEYPRTLPIVSAVGLWPVVMARSI
jgi:hypothetical protein